MDQLNSKKTLLADISLFIVAIVWGSGFIATKNALGDIPPLFLTGTRFALGGLI